MIDIKDLLEEIAEMSRPELVKTRDELVKDTEIPKKSRSQLLTAVENRLYELKNGKPAPKPSDLPCYFVSFESEGDKLSVITHKTVGEFVLAVEPSLVIILFYNKISQNEYEKLKTLGYGEV